MTCHKQIFDSSGIDHPTITTAAPTTAVGQGIDFSTAFAYETARWRKFLLTIGLTGGPSDINLWVRRAAGVSGTTTDDVWGLFQDMFGVIKLGKVATALPNGAYHFIIADIGAFAGLYIQASAGTMTATILPIQES